MPRRDERTVAAADLAVELGIQEGAIEAVAIGRGGLLGVGRGLDGATTFLVSEARVGALLRERARRRTLPEAIRSSGAARADSR